MTDSRPHPETQHWPQAVVQSALGALAQSKQAIGTRFLLWVDAVGGYLVCLADEIWIGQASIGNPVAVPILGEPLGQGRWIPVAVGFAGVLVASGLAEFSVGWPTGLAFCAACLWAFATIQVRQIALREPTIIQMLYSNAFFVVVCGGAMLFLWHPPSGRELALLVAVGVIGGFAQFSMFEGLRHAAASVLAPFQYSSLIWAFLLGWLIWGDHPRLEVWLGACLILGSGLLAIAQQRRRAMSNPG